MRPIWSILLVVSLAISAEASSPSLVTQATENLIDAVVTRPAADETPLPLPVISDRVKLAIAHELWNDPSIQASYAQLAANRRSFDWSRAVEELQERKAAWCLATGLCHPNAEVRLQCAKAIIALKSPEPARFILDIVDAYAINLPPDSNASIHTRLLRLMTQGLNGVTGLSISLKSSHEAEDLRAALPAWKHALRDRSGPITRSVKDRQAYDAFGADRQTFVLMIKLAPKAQGMWDSNFELTSVVLSVAPLSGEPLPLGPMGKPSLARARITPEQADLIMDALADEGFFDTALPVAAVRHDRYCSVEITCGPDATPSHFCQSFDWKPRMLEVLDHIQEALDGESARQLRALTSPLLDQRKEWSQQASASKP